MTRYKIIGFILTVLALIAGGIIFSSSADASGNKCVTLKEYRRLHTADDMNTVRLKFGTGGTTVDSYVQYAPQYSYDADGYPYVSSYIPLTDIVQVYKKCSSFDHGQGKVAINFDDYNYASSVNDFTQRAFQRVRFDKYDLDFYGGTYYFRKTINQRFTK